MSKFNFLDLTEDIRQLMIGEINADISEGQLFISGRLNQKGQDVYPLILINAVENGDEESLQEELDENNLFNSQEMRGDKMVKVPSNASKLLAQSEFNRYYIRAVCLKSIEKGLDEVEIYRARESSSSRSESDSRIGEKIIAGELLEDLRASIGIQPQILPEINSGLSVTLIE